MNMQGKLNDLEALAAVVLTSSVTHIQREDILNELWRIIGGMTDELIEQNGLYSLGICTGLSDSVDPLSDPQIYQVFAKLMPFLSKDEKFRDHMHVHYHRGSTKDVLRIIDDKFTFLHAL